MGKSVFLVCSNTEGEFLKEFSNQNEAIRWGIDFLNGYSEAEIKFAIEGKKLDIRLGIKSLDFVKK